MAYLGGRRKERFDVKLICGKKAPILEFEVLLMYDGATLEARKMIVSRIIQRVDVAKGYQLKITIYPEFQAFFQQAESWSGQVA